MVYLISIKYLKANTKLCPECYHTWSIPTFSELEFSFPSLSFLFLFIQSFSSPSRSLKGGPLLQEFHEQEVSSLPRHRTHALHRGTGLVRPAGPYSREALLSRFNTSVYSILTHGLALPLPNEVRWSWGTHYINHLAWLVILDRKWSNFEWDTQVVITGRGEVSYAISIHCYRPHLRLFLAATPRCLSAWLIDI